MYENNEEVIVEEIKTNVPEMQEKVKPKIERKRRLRKLIDNMLNKDPKDSPNPEYHENIVTGNEKKPEGINSKINDINEKLDLLVKPDDKKSLKQFKMPNRVRTKLKKMASKGKILVILLKTNKAIQPMITDIINGFVSINGIPHNCSMDFIYLWKGKYPCIVLNEWDLNPIGTKDYYEAVKEKRVAAPIAVVLRMIKSGQDLVGKDHKFGPAWIWIGLAAIAVIYLLFTK